MLFLKNFFIDTNIKSMPTSKKILINTIVILLIALGSAFLFACNKDSSSIYGTYEISSDDPAVQMFIRGQDTYIKLNEDQTIIYHNTINGKPKFHIEGTYTLDKKTNDLAIRWKEGKLPANLKVEKQGEDNVIKVGSTLYKKEKIKS